MKHVEGKGIRDMTKGDAPMQCGESSQRSYRNRLTVLSGHGKTSERGGNIALFARQGASGCAYGHGWVKVQRGSP